MKFEILHSTTISDVAGVAGVSISTVSFVLNGQAEKFRISRETQARVKAAVAQTGYVPNAAARSLVQRRRTVVGLSPSYALP